MAVVEGDLGVESGVAEGAGAEEEVGVLLEGVALDDVGVVAGSGSELVIEEEEPVGGCSHGGTPIRRAWSGLFADGYDSTGDGLRESYQVSFLVEIGSGRN